MSNTTNYNLNKPTYGTRNWDIPLNQNFDVIDSTMKSIDDKINSHKADNVTDVDGAHGLKIETGTFTPYFEGSVAAGSETTYIRQAGRYYKIGDRVTLDIVVTIQAKDATMDGSVRIKGIPFIPAYIEGFIYSAAIGYVDQIITTGYKALVAHLPAGFNFISICKTGDVLTTELSAADLQSYSTLRLQLNYQISY